MANWRGNFKNKYLKIHELDDGPIVTTIVGVIKENVGGDDGEPDPVAMLRIGKGLVLNKTKCLAIETIAGTPDEDAWPGVRIQIQKGMTTFKGKRVPCIEIVAPPPPTAAELKDAVGF